MITITAAELNIMVQAKDRSREALTSMNSRFKRLGMNVKNVARKMGVAFTNFKRIARKAFLGVSLVIAGVSAAVIKLTKDAIVQGIQLDKLSKTLGMTAGKTGELAYAMRQEHGDVEKLTKGILMLNRYIGYAGEEQELYTKHFKTLGIAYRETSGALRSSYDVFMDMVNVVGKGNLTTEKMDALMTLLGGRIMMTLLPAMKKGVKWFKEMGKQYYELTGLTEGQVNAFAKMSKGFDDKVEEMKTAWSGFKMVLAESLIPHIKPIVEYMTTVMIPKMREGFKANKEAMKEWAKRGVQDVLFLAEALMQVAKWIGKVVEGWGYLNQLRQEALIKIRTNRLKEQVKILKDYEDQEGTIARQIKKNIEFEREQIQVLLEGLKGTKHFTESLQKMGEGFDKLKAKSKGYRLEFEQKKAMPEVVEARKKASWGMTAKGEEKKYWLFEEGEKPKEVTRGIVEMLRKAEVKGDKAVNDLLKELKKWAEEIGKFTAVTNEKVINVTSAVSRISSAVNSITREQQRMRLITNE